MHADGTNAARLTDAIGVDSYRSWSPDGRRIAFRSDRDGQGDSYHITPTAPTSPA
jgi:Tol biopolymer transport system component